MATPSLTAADVEFDSGPPSLSSSDVEFDNTPELSSSDVHMDMSQVPGAVPGTPSPTGKLDLPNVRPLSTGEALTNTAVENLTPAQQQAKTQELIESSGQPRMVRGAREVLQPGQRLQGAADIVGGAVQGVQQTVLPSAVGTIGAAVEAPSLVSIGTGMAGGYLGSKGAEAAVKAGGGGPAAQELAGAAGGLVGSIGGGAAGNLDYNALRASLAARLGGRGPAGPGGGGGAAPTDNFGLPASILDRPQAVQHAAGRVTAIDQETGLPIVDRSAGGVSAGGGAAAPAATAEPETEVTESPGAVDAQGRQTVVKTLTKPAEQSLLDKIISDHETTAAALRAEVAGKSANDIQAMRDAIAETGQRAAAEGNEKAATEAAHKEIALDKIVAETKAREQAGQGGTNQPTAGQTIDAYRDKLQNPELSNRAITVRTPEGKPLNAVPIGGTRKGGDLDMFWGDKSKAQPALDQLKGKSGFDNARLQPEVGPAGNRVWGVQWGESVPKDLLDSPASPERYRAIGEHYGYKAEDITKDGEAAGKATAQEAAIKPALDQATNQPQPIGRTEPETGRKIVQPSDNPATNQALATSAMPTLVAGLKSAVAGIPGATLAGTRDEKNPERLAEKITGENQPAATVSDYGAAQISVDSPQARDQVAAAIQKQFPVVKTQDDFTHGDKDRGYRQLSLQVQMPNGVSQEVQIVPKEVYEVNKGEHSDYKKAREAEISGDTETAQREDAKAKTINDEAMAKFNDRNGIAAPAAAGPGVPSLTSDQVEMHLEKGTRVKMKDGTPGTVEWADQQGQFIRVKTDAGKRVKTLRGNVRPLEVKNAGQRGEHEAPSVRAAQPEKEKEHAATVEVGQPEEMGKLGQRAGSAGVGSGSNQPAKQGQEPAGKEGQPKPSEGAAGKLPHHEEVADTSPLTAKETEQPKETKPEEKETKYSYGNTQAEIPANSDAARALATARRRIAKEDLQPTEYGGDAQGLEPEPHITLRYGLKSDDIAGIRAFLKKQAPFEVTLGKSSAFEPSKSSDGGAPIIVPVESPELHRIEAEIDKHGDFIDRTFPEYKPHATLGYVKPEAAPKYKGMTDAEGKTFRVDSVQISDRDGNKETVNLEGKEGARGDQVSKPEKAGAIEAEKGPAAAGEPAKPEAGKPAGSSGTATPEVARGTAGLEIRGSDKTGYSVWNTAKGFKVYTAGFNRTLAEKFVEKHGGKAVAAAEEKPLSPALNIRGIKVTEEDVNFFIENPHRIIELLNDVGADDYRSDGNAIGLRGLYAGDDRKKPQPSRMWDDGTPTSKRLLGTSAVLLSGDFTAADPRSIDISNALKRSMLYGNGEYIAVVQGGIATGEGFNDLGEVVITDPKIIAYIRRSKTTSPAAKKATPPRQSAKATRDREERNRLLAEHFTPGNVIKSDYWKEYDKVLSFSPETSDKGWEVRVVKSDKEGVTVPGERPRIHHTQPDKRDEIVKRGVPLTADEGGDAKAKVIPKTAEGIASTGKEGQREPGSGSVSTGKPELSRDTEVLHRFPNEEDGTEAEVARNRITGKYSVILRDTDSGKALPSVARFDTEVAAIEKAREWASGKPTVRIAVVEKPPVEVTAEGVIRQEGVEEKPVPNGTKQLEPQIEVPRAGKNFEGRYLQAALAPAKEAWDKKLEDAPNVVFSDPKTRNGRKELTARTDEPDWEKRSVLKIQQRSGDSYSVTYETHHTPAGTKHPETVTQTVETGLTLQAAKKAAESRLRSGMLFDASKPFYSNMSREVKGFKPTAVGKPPKGFSADKLLVQVPGDGRFTIPNNPAAIEGAIRKTDNFTPTYDRQPTVRVAKAPHEFDNAKHIANLKRQIEENETDLRRAKANARLAGEIDYYQEQLAAAKEELEEAQKPKSSGPGTTLHSGFLDPTLFTEIFPSVTTRVKDWTADTVRPGDLQKEAMRETRGEKDRRLAIAIKQLEKVRKEWILRPRADSVKFFNAVEHAEGLTPRDLSGKDQALAKLFNDAFDKINAEIEDLRPDMQRNYLENYFPHIWKQPAAAGKIIKNTILGKRPFAGRGSFLKKRTIPTIQDGLDMGLEPASWNPVDLFLLKYNEMAQWLMGHQTLDMMKQAGTAVFVRPNQKAPDGWTQLDDKIGTVYRRITALDEEKMADVTYPGGKRKVPGAFAEDIEDATFGTVIIAGHYYAPPDAAKAFNNFVSRGLAGRSQIYDMVAWANNNLNALQLGISAFHFTTTAFNGSTSAVGLGIKQLSRGRIFDGARNLVFGLGTLPSIAQTALNGSRLLREYLEPGSYAKFAEEARWVAGSGGRPKMNTLDISPVAQMLNAFRNGAVIEGVGKIPATILHATVAPVMEYWVPRMKMGAFQQMAADILDRQHIKRPDGSIELRWSEEELRRRMQRAWNSVDNRFGQLIYDNLFWHKALRDVLQLSTRSVGWNYGDAAELGGGQFDTVRQAGILGRRITGKSYGGNRGDSNGGEGDDGGDIPRFTVGGGDTREDLEITDRMAFSWALPVWTAFAGAVLTYLWTGHGPLTWKDYFYPQTADGERHSIPGYAKDVVAFWHHPVDTVLNKMASIWTMTSQAINNRDLYGTEIRHKDDTFVKQAWELAQFAAGTARPFSMTGTQRLLEAKGEDVSNFSALMHAALRHPGDVALGNLGFQPAPSYIQNSPALTMARQYSHDNAPPGTRTAEQQAKRQARYSIEDMYRTGNVNRATIEDYQKRGLVTPKQRGEAMMDARRDPLVGVSRSLSVEQLLNVYAAADDKEKRALRPILVAKQPKIQEEIDPGKRGELKAAFQHALHPQQVVTRTAAPGSL